MASWPLAEAKNKLSEILNCVTAEGAQYISRRDKEFVVISIEEYRELKGEMETLKEWILNGPDLSSLDLERGKSPMRDISW